MRPCKPERMRRLAPEQPPGRPPSTPQVERLLDILQGEMSREQRQAALQLTDRKSFRRAAP